MRKHVQSSALLVVMLGVAAPAAAQTSSSGAGSGTSSPGVGVGGESETGVGIPGDAPVDNRTLRPLQREPSPGESAPGAKGTGAGPSSAAESMETHLSHKAPSKRLRNGLAGLHAANQSEIQAGKLAEQSASSPEVKAFARHMIEDHSQNDEQLTTMAGSRVQLQGDGLRATKKEAAASMKELQGMTGSSFDRAYLTAMVRDHRRVLAGARKLADQAREEGAKDWADYLDGTATAVQSHLSEAERLRSQNTASTDSNDSTGSSSDASSGSSDAE